MRSYHLCRGPLLLGGPPCVFLRPRDKIHRSLSSAGLNHHQAAGPTVRPQKHSPQHCSLYFLLHTDIRNKTAPTHTHARMNTHQTASGIHFSIFSQSKIEAMVSSASWLSTNGPTAAGGGQVVPLPNLLLSGVFSVGCCRLHPGCGLRPRSREFLPTPMITATGVSRHGDPLSEKQHAS